MKYTARQALCAHFLTFFYTVLCVFGCIGCVVTGFSIPVFSHVLYPGLLLVCLVVLLLDVRPDRNAPLRLLYYALLLGGSALYTGIRIDSVFLGLCYVAVYVFRWLCYGYAGLVMPDFLEDAELALLAAVGTPDAEGAVVALITEALLYIGWIIGCLHIILRTFSAKLSALLPIPFFILCFLVITATVPEIWAVTLLILFWILTLFTGASQKYNPIAAAAQTAATVLPVLLLFWGVLGVFPKENTVRARLQSAYDRVLVTLTEIGDAILDGGTGEGLFSVSVEGNEIAFSSLGRRHYAGRTVMHAESDTPGVYYLRENTYNTYTDTGWTYTEADVSAFSQSGLGEDIHTVSSRILMQNGAPEVTMSLTGANAAHLFTPYYFHEAETDGVYTGNGDRNLKNTQRDASYPMTLYRFSGVFADLQEDAVMTDACRDVLTNYMAANRSLYTRIDSDTATELRQILRQEGIPSAKPASVELWDLIAEITLFVRESADYSLDAPLPPGDEDFAVWFVRDAEVGYCTYFATAEVMLLRAVGIPARLAVGYLVNIADAGQQTPIRDSSAHAWAEVFDTRLGWIPIEATPPAEDGSGAGQEDNLPIPTPDTSEPPSETTADITEEEDTSAAPDTDRADTGSEDGTGFGNGSVGTDSVGGEGVGGSTGSRSDGMETPVLRALLYLCLFLLCAGVCVFLAVQYRAYRLRLLYRQTRGIRTQGKRMSGTLPPENEYALLLYRRCHRISAILGKALPAELDTLAERARFSQHVLTEEETACLQDAHHAYTEALMEHDRQSGRLLHRFVHQWIDVYY